VWVLYFAGDERFPLEVSDLHTVDETGGEELRDEEAAERQNGDDSDSKKDESFVISLHGLPYSAKLEDIADFLEGLNILCRGLQKEGIFVY